MPRERVAVAVFSSVQRWQGPLVNLAWRYCRDRGRAEEMAQDPFIRAWRGLSNGGAKAAFRHGCLR